MNGEKKEIWMNCFHSVSAGRSLGVFSVHYEQATLLWGLPRLTIVRRQITPQRISTICVGLITIIIIIIIIITIIIIIIIIIIIVIIIIIIIYVDSIKSFPVQDYVIYVCKFL